MAPTPLFVSRRDVKNLLPWREADKAQSLVRGADDLKKLLVRIRKWGLSRLGQCVLCKLALSVLQRVYRFDPWHASAPYICREYKSVVADMATAIKPTVAVEIGCGLGGIIAHVRAGSRYGFDRDPTVLLGARFLNKSTKFETGTFGDADVISKAIPERRIDVLILVNWPHTIKIDDLHSQLSNLQKKIPIENIIIDGLREEFWKNSNAHGEEALNRLGEIVEVRDGNDDHRRIYRLKPSKLAAPEVTHRARPANA